MCREGHLKGRKGGMCPSRTYVIRLMAECSRCCEHVLGVVPSLIAPFRSYFRAPKSATRRPRTPTRNVDVPATFRHNGPTADHIALTHARSAAVSPPGGASRDVPRRCRACAARRMPCPRRGGRERAAHREICSAKGSRRRPAFARRHVECLVGEFRDESPFSYASRPGACPRGLLQLDVRDPAYEFNSCGQPPRTCSTSFSFSSARRPAMIIE